MATRATYPIFKAFTTSGTLGIGYKLYTYEAGTTTLLTTYQDEAGLVPHTNPIVLDSLGEAEIFITEAAKFTLTDADGAVQTGWPVDDIDSTTVVASEVGFTPTGVLTSTNVQDAMVELVDDFVDLSAQFTGIPVVVGTETGVTTTGGIMGFDLSKTGANEITVSVGSCLDSTLAYQMSLAVADTVAIPTVANTIYHIFIVHVEASDTFEPRAYTTEAGVALDATVDYWRWIGFWRTNGSSECVVAIMVDGYMSFGKGSENIVATVNTTWGTKTTSSFVPDSRVSMIAFGARYATGSDTVRVMSSLDGTNAEPYITAFGSAGGDTEHTSWVGNLHPGMMLFPHTTSRQFKTDDGTASLLIFAVKVRR